MQQYRDNPNVNVHMYEDDSYGGGGGPPPQAQARNTTRVHPLQSSSAHHSDSHHQKLTAAAGGGGIDEYSSDAEKLSAILKTADVEGHKHTLSVDYFRFRKYLLLIPILLMSLLIAICGFVAASDIMHDSMKVHDSTMQDFLTMLVSAFGFLVLLLTLLGNGLDYNSKLGFHRAASEDLAGLCDRVRLYRMERAMDERLQEENEELKELFPNGQETGRMVILPPRKVADDDDDEDLPHTNAIIPHNGNTLQVKQQQQQQQVKQEKKIMKQTKKIQKRNDTLTKTLVKQKVRQAREEQELSRDVITFYGYHSELHQITGGCRSDVPPPISKFFRVMENRVELMSLSRLGVVEEESRMRKNQIIRLCANEIYNEISNHWSWPLSVPNLDRTIESALKRVGQLLNMNYRAQRRCKLIPCCPIPLCCKKRTTNNVFAIINEGIDQRELDMMQAERTEIVRMENEKRAKRNAGPEEVLEMRDTVYGGGGRSGGGGGGKRSVGGREPRGVSRGAGYNTTTAAGTAGARSRMSRDPDGETFDDMATEASFSFRGGGGGGGGGYASHYSQQSRGGGGEQYPQIRSSQYDDGESMLTEEDNTYGGSYISYDEEAGTYRDDEEDDSRDGGGAAAKKKKKKKKKSKKKKKKKSKSKKKVEEYDDEEYSEYSDGYADEEEYSEYSEAD
ncbi:LOW QUALITY PROTEIN: hypothetical protein ACHAXR_008078 [Thalassiosira sp. AJA248-18]